MATPRKGAIIKPFSATDIQRVTGNLPSTGSQTIGDGGGGGRDSASPKAMDAAFSPAKQFFPSGRPLKPVAPEGTTTGRAWDFPSFLNLNYIPRSEAGETGISFGTLRRMASPEHGGLDLLRLVIETRKDQMSAQRWSIRAKGDRNNTGGPKGDQIRQWLQKPDGIHTFRGWMRIILEDHFVLDQVAIYFNEGKSKGQKRPLWEIMSGDTIKPYIMADDGRTPLPPLPAYAQIIKGMPAEDYTLDELGVYVYNPLPNRLYGLSRVAQVITTVNTALLRALYTLEYFSSGTTPDAFMELPKEWSLTRIQQWQEWFNSELEGVASERRKVRFVPEGSNYTATKTEALKDVFDEWMARIICYCFSLPPQAFVKEVNRATAETAKEAAQEEGLEPTKIWFKDVVDDMLARADADDLELFWEDEEIVDPQAKAAVAQMLYGGGAGTAKLIMTLDEVRDMMSLPPATPEQKLELQPPAPETDPDDDDPDADDPDADGNGAQRAPKQPKAKKPTPKAAAAEKLAKKSRRSGGGRVLPPAPVSGVLQRGAEKVIGRTVGDVLSAQRDALHAVLSGKAKKAAGDAVVSEETLRELVRELDADPWNDELREEVRQALADFAAHAGSEAARYVLDAVGADDTATIESLTQASDSAVAWANARTGNLITQISETTKSIVNSLTANAMEAGLTNAQLAERLDGAFLFGADRAEMIAQTETQFAANHGALAGYQASGVVDGKAWFGEDPCDDCEENIEAGVIPLDEDFPTDDPAPPAHPRCKCSIAPSVMVAGAKVARFRAQRLAKLATLAMART